MPLAWTHAEYVKLVASRVLGRAFDRPEAVWQRYRGERRKASRAIWSEHAPIAELAAGASLIIALSAPASVRFGFDGWQRIADAPTIANSLGLHVLRIDTASLAAGQKVNFTFRFVPGDRWIGVDYHIQVKPSSS